MQSVADDQRRICHRFGADCSPPAARSKLGAALNVREEIWPLNGLRHPPSETTNGWYLWAGEDWSDDPDFFVPLHVEHLREWRPQALPYLALGPGWRFLIAPGYEDVWFDPALLESS